MLSRSAPVFYGDLRSHERVSLPFSAFITSCKQRFQNTDDGLGVCVESEVHGLTGSNIAQACLPFGDAPHQVYLAQVPILNIEHEERSQLEILREDIQTPTFLETKALASINLWMNSAQSRSSTHYDPHHNLLCIVAGRKQVALWPPSASPLLYPMSIYGEASNHSSVDLENPNFSIHSRAEHSMECSQKVILCAGDALFIPEGWFHQVDSDDLTIAINFWWQSSMMSSMLEHMDSYYLRRILRRVGRAVCEPSSSSNQARMTKLEARLKQNQILCKSFTGNGTSERRTYEQPNAEEGHHDNDLDQECRREDLKGNKKKHKITLYQLEPQALQALHELVSLVHDHVNDADQSQPVQSSFMNDSAVDLKGEYKKILTANAFCLEDDPVAKILWTLEPLILQNVLLAMVHNFPRTWEALILHMLSPVGAEVLTRKFDEMDQQTTEDRYVLYETILCGIQGIGMYYSMDIDIPILVSVVQAFRNVLERYLGVNFDGPKPSDG
ncbi:hypothetical protein HHK36_022663 [Tetracentron sinense]|uniref:JmjC domain-containing protein n=1 Tax=Tetracentron sinense TaxID=13715 RepID=A0A834YSD1_TETSI|nr:hypothetical protein HHK36_022663 [Tetracentron sinense]